MYEVEYKITFSLFTYFTAMAQAALNQHTECAICFNTYTDPHELSCAHTYCRKPCLKKLEKNNAITCPECRQITKVKDLRKDFKLQGLVDTYRNIILSAPGALMCAYGCKTKKVNSYCMPCEDYLCDRCVNSHKQWKGTKNHDIQSLRELKKSISTEKEPPNNFEIIKQDHISAIEQVREKEKILMSSIGRLTKSEDEHKKAAIAALDEIINQAEAHKNFILTSITSAVDSGRCEIYEQLGLLSQHRVTLLAQLKKLENDDKKNLTAKCQQELKREVENIQFQLKAMDVTRVLEVGMKINDEEVDFNELISIETGHIFNNPNQGLYTELMKKGFKLVKSVDCKSESWRVPEQVIIVNNQIWCNLVDKIFIFSRQCEKLKEVDLPENIGSISGISFSRKAKEVIISCDHSGIHRLGLKAGYVGEITGGHFGCISEDIDGVLWVLQRERGIPNKCCFVTLTWNASGNDTTSGSWILGHTMVRLDYPNIDAADLVAVNDTTIMVSSYMNHNIYEYNRRGQCVGAIATSETSTCPSIEEDIYGNFEDLSIEPQPYGPRICGLDRAGNMLIADQNKGNVRVYSAENAAWGIVRIKDLNDKPNWVCEDGLFLWLVTMGQKLMKYRTSNV